MGGGHRRRKRGRRGSSQATVKQLLLHLRETCWAYIIPRALCGVQFSQKASYIKYILSIILAGQRIEDVLLLYRL